RALRAGTARCGVPGVARRRLGRVYSGSAAGVAPGRVGGDVRPQSDGGGPGEAGAATGASVSPRPGGRSPWWGGGVLPGHRDDRSGGAALPGARGRSHGDGGLPHALAGPPVPRGIRGGQVRRPPPGGSRPDDAGHRGNPRGCRHGARRMTRSLRPWTAVLSLLLPWSVLAVPSPYEEKERDWAFYASLGWYFVPDQTNYPQPTVTADRGPVHIEARYNYEA